MFIVRIDDLTDEQLEFFGFVRVHQGSVFSTYLHVYSGEDQIVSNRPPRYLQVEDVNDATQISPTIIVGPPRGK